MDKGGKQKIENILDRFKVGPTAQGLGVIVEVSVEVEFSAFTEQDATDAGIEVKIKGSIVSEAPYLLDATKNLGIRRRRECSKGFDAEERTAKIFHEDFFPAPK